MATTPKIPKRSSKAVNAANLAALGVDRLAQLLLEVAADSTAAKRMLKLELAGQASAADLAVEVAKRLDFIAAGRTRIHWRRYKEFVRDLDMHRRAIAERLAELDPALALPLIVRLATLNGPVFDRVNDGKGEVEAVFEAAIDDAARISALTRLADQRALSDQLFSMLTEGRADLAVRLLTAAAPALGGEFLSSLRAHIETAIAARPRPHSALRAAAQALADLQGDVDGYIAGFAPSQLVLPPVGAQVARRLLQAGRLEEARGALERSAPRLPPGVLSVFSTPRPHDPEWEEANIDLLEAEGDAAGAQAARWAGFEETLSEERLRAYLKRLADFDDVEAEDRAIEVALGHRDAHAALRFLIGWPALKAASELVVERQEALKPHRADLLREAARRLEGRYPLAATILLRTMILDIARHARGDDYGEAQQMLLEAASLAPGVTGDAIESHDDFVRRIAAYRRW